MALFPNVEKIYYNADDKDILQRMEYFYDESITINQSYWGEADTDTRFYSGDQNLLNELHGDIPIARRKNFNFNRTRPIVSVISGHQRRNRKSTVVVPVENGDQQTADQFTKLLFWMSGQENMLETISEAFEGALITGMNLLQVWVDYRNDPISGNIKLDNCNYNSYLIDPYFKKADLSDCNGLWKRSYLTKREVVSLMPDYKKEIASYQGIDASDGKFQYMPETFCASKKNLLTYDEFYYKDSRKQRLLVDTQTNETIEWRSGDNERLSYLLQMHPQLTVIDQEIPTVKLAVVVQGKVFYNGANPLGIDSYPFVPVFAYYNPQIPYYPLRIQGVVRGLRDAQYLYNRRKIIELDMLESQINSGFKYKENAVVNHKDLYMTGQGRGLALKAEASMDDVQQIIPPQIPASTIQLSEILGRELREISGVNEELLGSAVDEKAGVLAMLRQGAGLTTLQGLFDQLDRSQKILGKILIKVIQENFSPGKVKRIINEEPSPQFYNKAFGNYDAAIEEGFNTTTQKQMQFIQLTKLREIGVAIPDEALLEAATIQNKSSLVDMVSKQSQQQQQMQQMKLETDIQEQQARIELSKSRAVADRGLGVERLSRVEENRAFAVERLAEAQKDRNMGVLNLSKAMKELEDIDIAQIEKLLTLAQLVKGVDEEDNKKAAATTSEDEENVPQYGQENRGLDGGGLEQV